MIALSPASALLAMWITFAVVALAGSISVLVWAVRKGQFSNQDHARYLALKSGIPKDWSLPDMPTAPAAGNEKKTGAKP